MKSVGCLTPIHLVKDGDYYYTHQDAKTVEAAKTLEWTTIPAIIQIVSDGHAKDVFAIRLKGALSKIDFGPGPVGAILRQIKDEYIECFGETELQFIEFASINLGLPIKVVKQSLEEPEDGGIKTTDFFMLLNDIKKHSPLRYKSSSKLRVCPLCGWESGKLSAPDEAMPAIIKEICIRRIDFMMKNMDKKQKVVALSLMMDVLRRKFDELRS